MNLNAVSEPRTYSKPPSLEEHSSVLCSRRTLLRLILGLRGVLTLCLVSSSPRGGAACDNVDDLESKLGGMSLGAPGGR